MIATMIRERPDARRLNRSVIVVTRARAAQRPIHFHGCSDVLDSDSRNGHLYGYCATIFVATSLVLCQSRSKAALKKALLNIIRCHSYLLGAGYLLLSMYKERGVDEEEGDEGGEEVETTQSPS